MPQRRHTCKERKTRWLRSQSLSKSPIGVEPQSTINYFIEPTSLESAKRRLSIGPGSVPNESRQVSPGACVGIALEKIVCCAVRLSYLTYSRQELSHFEEMSHHIELTTPFSIFAWSAQSLSIIFLCSSRLGTRVFDALVTESGICILLLSTRVTMISCT